MTARSSGSSSGKGKEKAADFLEDLTSEPEPTSSDTSSLSSSSSDSESDYGDDSEDEITPEYLQGLLQKARESATAPELDNANSDVLTLENEEQPPIPQLNPGSLPPPYLQISETRGEAASLVRDPEVEEIEHRRTLMKNSVAPPPPPPELTKSGKPLTKKEKKELKKQTAGPNWFDMPAPSEAELPQLYREVEALRLRNQLDPKRFYRKDEGEGKGIKGLPKYFALGQIVPSSTPFGGSSADNLPRNHRKRTLVDELLDDAEAKRYAKKKFNELQAVRGAKGKNTLRVKQALRKPKW